MLFPWKKCAPRWFLFSADLLVIHFHNQHFQNIMLVIPRDHNVKRSFFAHNMLPLLKIKNLKLPILILCLLKCVCEVLSQSAMWNMDFEILGRIPMLQTGALKKTCPKRQCLKIPHSVADFGLLTTKLHCIAKTGIASRLIAFIIKNIYRKMTLYLCKVYKKLHFLWFMDT